MHKDQDEKPLLRQLLDASSIGLQLVISTFVGFAVGYFLDRLFNTSPWLTIIFLIAGIISGFRDLLRLARRGNGSGKGDD